MLPNSGIRVESGVDIPTINRWLGHKDGGAPTMKGYGYLREEHSFAMIKKMSFASGSPGVHQAPSSPREERVGRGTRRGETNKTRLLSLALSSIGWRRGWI